MPNTQRPIVLLVEDSEDDFFFFRRALNKTGLPSSLFHANDGGAALSYLEAALATPDDPAHPRPDLVFLDLKLPTFSGFEILTWIRQHAGYLALDVTVLSGSEDASDIARARSLGANGYLAKPVSTEELKSRLGAWSATPGGAVMSLSAATTPTTR